MTEFLGQSEQEEALLAAAHGGALHHAWLLTGPKGIGKAGFARRAALRLLAESAGPAPGLSGLDVPADHPIARLIEAGSHPDYRVLERLPREPSGELARNIPIDQVRTLQRLFATTPSQSSRRVVIIDSADDLERPAANALLKNLEEPPADTLFLLVSHTPGRLLATIRSRCRVLRFHPLDDAAMAAVLGAHLPDADAGEIAALVAAGGGAPGNALRFAGLDIGGLEAALADFARTGDPSNAGRSALARALALKAAQPRYEAFLERAPSFIAHAAHARSGVALADALALWEKARGLAAGAVQASLDPQNVVFELGSLVAALAPKAATVKG
ncbi:MAG: DNA polymerase III subunit delta' [Sphingomonas sp. SCN 67-18]|uniref:DNA polymerase III subunit delta' n=1 Tax=uncultured Sphingomonas sp. TaxID=158754 RepID=UPI000869F1E0|nr:DNA polymerase III subunit delta' [Sphingomonas sp. SCN 67-18]ODU19820.1 MAG: DNA polymerase III subunit delta' [Sphingomonas sp. SCN 67-18]